MLVYIKHPICNMLGATAGISRYHTSPTKILFQIFVSIVNKKFLRVIFTSIFPQLAVLFCFNSKLLDLFLCLIFHNLLVFLCLLQTHYNFGWNLKLILKLGSHHSDKLHCPSLTPEINVVRSIKGLSPNLHHWQWVGHKFIAEPRGLSSMWEKI